MAWHFDGSQCGRPAALLALVAGLALGPVANWARAQNNQPSTGGPGGQILEEPDFALPPRPAQPAAAAPAQPEREIIFGPFAEPVQLRTLLELAVRQLRVQIAADVNMTGSVMVTQELRVPESRYLALINSFLEQNGFSLVPGAYEGFYQVVPTGNVPTMPDGQLPTTLVIRTPNSKPSVLQAAILNQITGGGRIAALDELGVLIVTNSPGKALEVKRLVERILAERDQQQLITFDLLHLSAVAAREQVLRFAGVLEEQAQPGLPDPRTRGQQADAGASLIAGALSNLGQRLMVAPSGNRLVFRGTEDEAGRVSELVRLVDVVDNLTPRRYTTGSSTPNIAALAENRGLGSIVQFSSLQQQQGLPQGFAQGVSQMPGQASPRSSTGGSAIVVDEVRQSIVFYGTPQQHERFAELVGEYDPGDEQVVIRNYRLDWANAEAISDLLRELVEGQTASASSQLLPGGGQLGRGSAQARPVAVPAEGVDGVGDIQSANAFVTFDAATNQVIVRAPANMQPQFRKIIESLDRRRPQVFIEAKIVAVTWTDDMRLAFESQIINAGGREGAFQQNFGLGSTPSGDITARNQVTDGLLGATVAIIRSNYVPLVINALQRNVDGRILASPQLLVDDNTEAFIASQERQPTSSTSQDGTSTQTGFGGFEDAGPELTVTPRINPGGFVTLKYDLTLSNFVGQGSEGLPAPQQRRSVRSDSVTIPSDSTIIVGGITIDDRADTKVSVPLLGRIPILGYLFSDSQWNKSKTTLYVFITPKVLYEPTVQDYQLLTEGARRIAEIDPDIPPLETYMVRVLVPGRLDFGGGRTDPIEAGNEFGIELIEPGR